MRRRSIQSKVDSLIVDLMLYWTFNSDLNDQTDNNRNGTASGVLTYTNDRDGNPNSAVAFSNSETLNVNYNAASDPNWIAHTTDSYSISFWIRLNNPADTTVRFAIALDRLDAAQPIWVRNNNIYWRYFDGTPHDLVYPLSDTNWHHVVYILDAVNNEFRGYFDTNNVPPVSITPILHPNKLFQVGSVVGASDDIDGALDNIRLYRKVLTFGEVVKLYNNYM